MSSSAVETVARGGSGSRGRPFIFCEGGGHNRDSGRRGGMVGAMHYNDPRLGPEPKHLPDQCKKNEKAQMPPLPLPALPPLDISPAPRTGPLSARLPPVGSGQDRGGGGGRGMTGCAGGRSGRAQRPLKSCAGLRNRRLVAPLRKPGAHRLQHTTGPA